ncbi:MAG: NAD(P)/FAD-dependent oxidoreductase [Candidatus Lokiarchaeota archaeon]|nr:NAD(P)/FAD-dependent oxidoreductase [Candidatus Lokiarchaeota archaeon]
MIDWVDGEATPLDARSSSRDRLVLARGIKRLPSPRIIMVDHDLLIVGGGIAGSVAAKFAARAGLNTLFIEKEKTPRNKPCSGIQFPYFEKIIGEKVPVDRLCKNQLSKVHLTLPDGSTSTAGMRMLNFMRKPFDDWLNRVAQENGATFMDQTEFEDCEAFHDHVDVTLKSQGGNRFHRTARYLIDASGLRPVVRLKLHPDHFRSKATGATVNYYIDGPANLDKNTLYQFWNLDFCDAMFAWVYNKTLDDGQDYWVIGTGCNSGKVMDRQKRFYDFVKEKYNVDGKIVKTEGYSSTIDMKSKNRVWLGEGRILMVGDAAGLVDQARGVGMDAAAMSGRFVAKAIRSAIDRGMEGSALEEYRRLMRKITAQAIRNQDREINVFSTNAELQAHLRKTMVAAGIGLYFHNFMNMFRPAERLVLLPP